MIGKIRTKIEKKIYIGLISTGHANNENNTIKTAVENTVNGDPTFPHTNTHC